MPRNVEFCERSSFMKKKFIRISIITVILLLVYIFGRGIYFYGKYFIPDEEYFGSQYKEILHIMSFQDKKQANEIMKIVDDAFSFIGNKEKADGSFGELSQYCVTDEDAVIEEHDLKLVTADFNKNNGYLWFVYNQEAFDSNNQTTMGSWDILVRATLEKTNQGWIVVDTKEHP